MKIEELEDREILMFVKKLLWRFEDIKNPFEDKNGQVHRHKHVPVSLISSDATNELIEKFHIQIKNVKDGNISNEMEEGCVKQNVDVSKCKDKDVKKYTYYTLYAHLRNSFAHNFITKENDCYLFKDMKDNGELTMAARIKKKDFFDYIDAIYEESKKTHDKTHNNKH